MGGGGGGTFSLQLLLTNYSSRLPECHSVEGRALGVGGTAAHRKKVVIHLWRRVRPPAPLDACQRAHGVEVCQACIQNRLHVS